MCIILHILNLITLIEDAHLDGEGKLWYVKLVLRLGKKIYTFMG